MKDTVLELQQWFENQCDGHWEHQHGFKIETLDNPGWLLEVDLQGTPLEGVAFAEVHIDRGEMDWMRARVEGDRFRGFGGPRNLAEIIRCFLEWSSHPPSAPLEPSSSTTS